MGRNLCLLIVSIKILGSLKSVKAIHCIPTYFLHCSILQIINLCFDGINLIIFILQLFVLIYQHFVYVRTLPLQFRKTCWISSGELSPISSNPFITSCSLSLTSVCVMLLHLQVLFVFVIQVLLFCHHVVLVHMYNRRCII